MLRSSLRRISPVAAPVARPWRLDDRAATAVGIAAAGLAWIAIVLLSEPYGRPWGTAQDARCYWVPGLDDPYRHSSWTNPIAYVYSPAFLQLLAPIRALPWQGFVAVWTAVLLVAIRWLTGPRLLAFGVGFAALELAGGNISLLLAAAIVAGFRWPAAWAFVVLTKVTPGVGLLWFLIRREWRSLAVAAGATAAVVGLSATLVPEAWAEWIGVLARSAGRDGTWAAVPVPFWARLPAAVAVVAWGALTDRRWTVPVAAMLALPALWYGGLSMLLATIALRDREQEADPDARAETPGEDGSTRDGIGRPAAEPRAAGA